MQCPPPSPELRPLPPKQQDPRDPITLLRLCQTLEELTQAHSLLLKTSLLRHPRPYGRLLLSAASLPCPAALPYARKLLAAAPPPRDAFLYNALLRGYSRRGLPDRALRLFPRMLADGAAPDGFTLTFVLASCATLGAAPEGRQVHGRMEKEGRASPAGSTQSWNALMDFYVKTGAAGELVRRVFGGIPEPDLVSWNCLLCGYVKDGGMAAAAEVFDEMPARDAVSWTTMLVGYTDAGMLTEARCLFDSMPERNVVSWTVMINGYVRSGRYVEALAIFEEMQLVGVKADKITLTSLLSACASLGALDQGRWVHTFIDKYGIEVDAHLSAALVDLYAKCGSIDAAMDVFQGSTDKKVFVWNAILGGLAMHSRGEEALRLFSEMLRVGIKPNEITFICVLSACSHSGLVEDGLWMFSSMVKGHGVSPTIEHYNCMVDLLGRAGLLNDARRLIEEMPLEADANIWRALLAACRHHREVGLGDYAGKLLLKVEPSDDGNYVLLSNVYALANQWGDAAKLRRKMRERGVRKVPGFSSIEMDGVVHMFSSGDLSHPRSQEIFAMLDLITCILFQNEFEPSTF